MSDRAALLAAIVGQPDEDTPRLVYADWLDEHGEPKRAAHIRAQIERYRAAHADTATNTVSTALEPSRSGMERVAWPGEVGAEVAARRTADKRLFKLTAKGEGVSHLRAVRFCDDVRGFYDGISVGDPAQFLRKIDDIFRAAPITSVVFDHLSEAQAVEFIDSGYFAQIRDLDLGQAEPGAIEVLGRAKAATGVRSLWLDAVPDGGAVFEALARGSHWTGLERLHATNFEDQPEPPTEEGIAEALARPQLRNLRSLVLWGDGLGNDAAKVIAKCLPELRFLDLALNRLTGEGGAALAASKTLRHLRHLDISTCSLEDGEVAVSNLLTTKNMPNLCVLRLDGNFFSDLRAKVLAKPGRGPTLRVLDLQSTRPTPVDIEALAKCPAVRGVWQLNLGSARIGDEHFARFIAHSAFEQLTYLDLHSNEITASGAKALAAWPGAANLQWLDLDNNPIGESGAKALAASPHLTGLKYVHFSGRGTAILKRRFKKAFT